MLFFSLNNINIQLAEIKFTWSFYNIAKALLITRQVEFINKKEFAKATLNKNINTFEVHISFLSLKSKMTIYLSKKAEIALLLDKKITVLVKYLDFVYVFSK